jgi:gamma-glutamylcyclotransferase (GGCT)/AIG2-like uncharacterized protein YtfP
MTESAMNRREQSMNPNEPSKENTTGILRLFVYGTLKRGYWNHDRFCRGVLDVQEAVVRGRLYEMPSGIPVLEVPETDVLAHGTADPFADVATQARFSGHLASCLEPMPESATAGDWGPVYGELLTFDDPSIRLPAIDRLEGFSPEGRCFYRRVLFPVSIIRGSFTVAWVYVGEEALNAQTHWQLKEVEEWNPERK